jgi:NAD(P)-dependent dehydrogenase (short-subunit alcohol dehydrogenase family)
VVILLGWGDSAQKGAGGLDVVVDNAGHLYVGYVEAFTAEDIAHLLDINVFGVQRVNRAARRRRQARAPRRCGGRRPAATGSSW